MTIQIDGFLQEIGNSTANALELHLSSPNLSKCFPFNKMQLKASVQNGGRSVQCGPSNITSTSVQN